MLVIRDLVKIYPGPVTALAGVDLDVPNGMFGLLGPNGAGKTTLMRILAGLLEPSSGTATLDGESMLDSPERIWGRLGYLPQDFGFFPHLTGEKMLEYLLRSQGRDQRRAASARFAGELLERVNLTFAARRKVKTYSGGMRQRLGIAQAIAGNPRLIIVDEPTAGLDPEERLRFYRLLSELAAGSDRPPVDPHRRRCGRPLPPIRHDPRRPADRQYDARRGPRGHRRDHLRGHDLGRGIRHGCWPIPSAASPRRIWSRAATACGSTSRTETRPRVSSPWRRRWKTPIWSRSRPGRLAGLDHRRRPAVRLSQAHCDQRSRDSRPASRRAR